MFNFKKLISAVFLALPLVIPSLPLAAEVAAPPVTRDFMPVSIVDPGNNQTYDFQLFYASKPDSGHFLYSYILYWTNTPTLPPPILTLNTFSVYTNATDISNVLLNGVPISPVVGFGELNVSTNSTTSPDLTAEANSILLQNLFLPQSSLGGKEVFTLQFDSANAPVWSDFIDLFRVPGPISGTMTIGFFNPNIGMDPSLVTDGNYSGWIVAPGAGSAALPEPSTWLSLGSFLLVAMLLSYRKSASESRSV